MQPETRSSAGPVGDDAYTLFFERSPRPMYVYDVQSYALIDVNDAALRLYGYAREAFLAMTVLDLRNPEDVPAFLEYLKVEHRQGTILRQRTSDGTTLFVEVAWSRFDRDGRALRLAVVTDVTEREHAKARLANSERRFRTIFDASPIGIVLTDDAFRIVDANPAFCRFLGYEREEVLGKAIPEITHPDDAEIDVAKAKKIFAGKLASYRREKRYLTKDGTVVWGSLVASPIVDPDGVTTGAVGLIEDITERKRSQERAVQAATEAQDRLADLTPRELELLDAVDGEAMTTRELAQQLHISARTAESHLASIYRKLGVSSRDAALTEYRRLLEAVETPLLTSGYAPRIRELRT